jgi:hypothetical protein
MNYSNQLSFLRLNITVGNEAQQEKLSMNNYESATEFSYKNVSNSKELVQQYLELCTLQLCNPCQYALLNCDRKYLRSVIFAKFLEAMHFEVCNIWYFYSKLCNFLRYAIFLIDYIAEGFTVFQNLIGQNISREIKRI